MKQKNVEVYYVKEERGYTMGQKEQGYSTREKRTVPSTLHWLLFFDKDSTEKLVGTLLYRKMLGVHMSVCVLNCTVPDVSFGER